MANTTSITIYCLPRDLDYFQDSFDQHDNSERFDGLIEMRVGDARPDMLNELGERLFVGQHGSHAGDYPAQLVVCGGKKNVLGHPCDENGRLVMGTDIYDLNAPLWIGTNSAQFVLHFREVLAHLLKIAGEAVKKRANKNVVKGPGVLQGPPPKQNLGDPPAEGE